MRKLDQASEVRVEVVTTTFVASGRPEGVHDLGRFLENLNNPAISRQIELNSAAVRPLYRASAQLPLDAPMLVRRDEIIFATFEGPHFTRGAVRPDQVDVPILLLAPPFQIQGKLAVAAGANNTEILRARMQGFVAVSDAQVYDADGNILGEGEQIIVNGAAVQMTCATALHIPAAVSRPTAVQRHAAGRFVEEPAVEEQAARAA